MPKHVYERPTPSLLLILCKDLPVVFVSVHVHLLKHNTMLFHSIFYTSSVGSPADFILTEISNR